LQKAARAKKDPNAPKRGQSGYMIWLNESRKSLTKPGMSVTDVAKAAGIEWGKLKDKSVRCSVLIVCAHV
jgi:structure-specific recognition protein 1